MGDQRTRRACLSLFGSAVAAGLAGCSSDPPTSAGPTTESGGSSEGSGTTPTPSPSANFGEQYVDLYDRIVGSVVAVRVPQGGLGSGFLYDENYAVTNYHVVTDADSVEIQYARGESATARVVGRDRYTDLAVVRVERKPGYAEPLPLHSAEPTIGTRVAAIGSPYGLEGSMTHGIVSGVDRLVPSPNADFRIPNTIQTDAPVNPGNSGGPLVNLDGDVLGVVNSGAGDNIAFAISAALVERVVPAIIETGEYDHPSLGVRLVDVTPAVARANDLERARGVLVTNVAEGTPAADVLRGSDETARVDGFRVPVGGDVILSIEGTQIGSSRDLRSYLELHASPGETVELAIIRDGRRRTVSVELATLEQAG